MDPWKKGTIHGKATSNLKAFIHCESRIKIVILKPNNNRVGQEWPVSCDNGGSDIRFKVCECFG